jgi:DNA-binding transcriptional MerR regulator
MTRSLTIAEASERTGLTPHTLRYYERDGLLISPVARSSSGHRAYSEQDLRWIVMLTCLRATGMPIVAIRRYVRLVQAGAGNENQRLELLRAHRREVLARLAEVTDHLSAIDGKIALYEDSLSAADTTADTTGGTAVKNAVSGAA